MVAGFCLEQVGPEFAIKDLLQFADPSEKNLEDKGKAHRDDHVHVYVASLEGIHHAHHLETVVSKRTFIVIIWDGHVASILSFAAATAAAAIASCRIMSLAGMERSV